MLANAASLATSKEYVLAVVPVETAFFTVSVSGCSAYLNVWLTAGEIGVGAVNVTPVTASTATVVVPVATASDGRVGLALVHAVERASSAHAPQIAKVFTVR